MVSSANKSFQLLLLPPTPGCVTHMLAVMAASVIQAVVTKQQ
jgi:hypothetical protein